MSRTRDPIRAGAVGIAVIAALLAAAVFGPALHLRLRTTELHATLANASGLHQGDPVYVAGIPNGRVTGVELDGATVDVTFRLDAATTLGDETRASVKILTMLGRRYLGVEPAGSGAMQPGDTIPMERTVVPYIFDDLGHETVETAQELDVGRLRTLVDTLVAAAPNPADLRKALDGVAAVSALVADDDKRIGALLTGARELTGALLGQREGIQALLRNADQMMRILVERKDTLAALLADVRAVTEAVSRFLRDHATELDGVLTSLHSITATLSANADEIGRLIERFGPFARYFATVSGNGSWIDVAAPVAVVPDNLLCLTGVVDGCS